MENQNLNILDEVNKGAIMGMDAISFVSEKAKDEDFKHVTITAVEATNDLSFAKVFFTTTDDREKVEHDLNNAAGFFRSLLAERLEVRHTPELRFIFDESIEYGAKIEKIIEQLHEEE